MPKARFLEVLTKVEEEFKSFHGREVNFCKDPIATFTSLIEPKFKDVPREVLKVYSKTRFFITFP